MRERKPFDAAVRQFLDQQAAGRSSAVPVITTEEKVRQARAYMVHMVESRVSFAGLPNGVVTTEVEIASGLGARLYRPALDEERCPMLVYVHGGGWALASVEVFDPFCRLLSEAAGVVILSIEYRLAPEHPHPAGLEDVLTAVRWAGEHAADWGADASRLALGGDSAGGNLAAVAANLLCERGEGPALRAQMLLYPATDHPGFSDHSGPSDHASYTENAHGYGLEAPLMRWFWDLYAPDGLPADPTLSPLRIPAVPALPPTLVATAEYDVLRDEGIAYAEKLRAAGIDVTHLHSPDMGHNFPATPSMVGRFPQSIETLKEIADWLRATLASTT